MHFVFGYFVCGVRKHWNKYWFSAQSLLKTFLCACIWYVGMCMWECMFVYTCFSECICCGQRTNMCMSACLPPCFIQCLLLGPAYDRIAGLRNPRVSCFYISSCCRSSAIKGMFYYMWVLFGWGIWTHIFMLVWQALNPLSQLINSLYPMYSFSDPME